MENFPNVVNKRNRLPGFAVNNVFI